MYCVHCGANLGPADLYCTRCGKPRANGQPAVAAAPFQPSVALPPNLHWGLVLFLTLITCGIFGIVWTFVQAIWAKKLDPNTNSVPLIGVYTACVILVAPVLSVAKTTAPFGILVRLIGLICLVIGVFKIKASMEEYYTSTEDIGLQLSGVMTFFFYVIYFQYHINRIARWKKTGVLT